MLTSIATTSLLFPPPPRALHHLPTRLHCLSPPHPTPTTSTSGLVLAGGEPGSWDATGAGSPVVKRFLTDSSGDRWLLWYHSGPRLGLAASADGIHWRRGPSAADAADSAGECMQPSTDWWAFDTAAVRPSDVLVMSNPKLRSSAAVYWLYYTGSADQQFTVPFPDASVQSLPGLAISQDGRHWARIEGEHHTGALLAAGAPGEWDKPFVAAPKVVYHADGDLRMYYHSFDEMSQRYAIGIARSRDGIRWVKLGKVLEGGEAGSFDAVGVRHGHVVRDRVAGSYVMAYEGVDESGRASIGMAVSDDGLKGWRRCGALPVVSPSVEEDGWDGISVGSPCLVQLDGVDEWRLYYMGVGRDGRTAIGMASSEGPELRKFEKCEAART